MTSTLSISTGSIGFPPPTLRTKHTGKAFLMSYASRLARPLFYARSSRSLLLKRAYERCFDFPNLNAASAIHYTAEEERDRAAA